MRSLKLDYCLSSKGCLYLSMRNIFLCISIVFSGLLTTACYYHHNPDDFLYASVSYSTQVKPILVNNCYRCHTPSSTDPDRPIGGPYWDDFPTLQSFATTPSSINPSVSIIVARLKGIEQPQMPYHSTPLSADDIRIIQSWCVLGAPNN